MSETKEQEALFERAQYNPITRDYLFAIPNDGKRSIWEGAKFKRRGLKPGMPDVCLPYPSNGFHALYIELKRADGKNKPTALQNEWLTKLQKAGNAAHVGYGWEHAWQIITDYLQLKKTSMDIKINFENSLKVKSAYYSEANHHWEITMTAAEWPWMMKSAKVIRCPDCKGNHIVKNGKEASNYKQQYKCLNENCNRYSFIAD